MFEVVILAGGFGTRIKEVNSELPKPMLEVGSLPFLYRIMQKLEANGCKRIVLSLFFMSDYIKKRIEEDNPVSCSVVFVVESEPLGTGGAVKLASKEIIGDSFIVVNGDTYLDIDYEVFYQESQNYELSLCAIRVPDCSRYGRLTVNEDGYIESFSEKSYAGPGLINGGCYYFKKSVISSVPLNKFSLETDFLIKQPENIRPYITSAYFIDIGIPKDYYRACEYFS